MRGRECVRVGEQSGGATAESRAILHLFLVHDTHEFQLPFSNLYYFLNEPCADRALKFRDSAAWSVITRLYRD